MKHLYKFTVLLSLYLALPNALSAMDSEDVDRAPPQRLPYKNLGKGSDVYDVCYRSDEMGYAQPFR